jgi:hypothetical protein
MIKYCKVNKCRFPVSHVTLYHLCGNCKKFGHGLIECGNNKINNLIPYLNDKLPDYEKCFFGECLNSLTHKTESHTCTTCYDRLHSSSTCPLNNKINKECNIVCPKCRTTNKTFFNSYGSENECIVCFDKSQVFLPECGHECLCLKCSKQIDLNKTEFEIYDEKYLIDHNYDLTTVRLHLKEYPSYVIIYESMGHCTLIRRLNNSSKLEGLFIHSDDGYDPNKIKFNDNFINGYCKIELELIHNL